MEQLKSIKEQLIAQVQAQMSDLKCVDTKELGEVIDMIYDLSKSIYYCTVVKAMEEGKEKEEMRGYNNNYYYTEKYLPMPSYEDGRDYDYFRRGKLYTTKDDDTPTSGTWIQPKDEREGKSGMRRMMYMESKQTHQDMTKKIQDLENYMKDLSTDITEMLVDASPEEKATVQKKMNMLLTKIQNV